MMRIVLPLVIGYLLDLIIGDPHGWWHPVCAIGKLIQGTEKLLRSLTNRCKSKDHAEKIAGVVLVLVVCIISMAIPAVILIICDRVNAWLGIAVRSIMCGQLLATKSLKDESMKVYQRIEREDIKGARYAVSMIVGRDTQALDMEGVTKAAVETVAENTSDGCIAPMIFMAIGGPVLGFFYKAVNTMDSMVGYKNEKYLSFGWAAAKLDDMVNYLPARISGWLMVASAVILRLNGKNAKKIYLRDRYNHASPNSAHTEAVAAGALGVQLAGDAYYFGKLYKKKTIGDPIRPVEADDIPRVNMMLYVTSMLAIIIVSVVHTGIILISFA